MGGTLALVWCGAFLVSTVSAAEGAAAPVRSRASLYALFGLLLGLSGLVSATETAIFSLDKLDVAQLRQRGGRKSRALLYLLDHPNDALTTILVLNNLINVALSLTAGALTELHLGGRSAAGLALAGFGATGFLLVFGEVLPKCLAHVTARLVAPAMAWPTALAAHGLTPARALMDRLIRWVFRRLNVPESTVTQTVSEEELKAMMTTGEVSIVLEEDEREMIEGVFELGQTFAEEIMVPRSEVLAFPDTLSQEEMLGRLREIPYSRVPIFHDHLDHLVGFVLAKEVLLNPERPWKEHIREAMLVPSRVRLFDLLARFRRHATKLAILIDEFGQVAGIATLHDVLEEIVGDIVERHEQVVEECQRIGERRWRVRGQMNLEELGERLEVAFPENLGTTIGGFFMNMLGRVPTIGSELAFNGLTLRVTRMVGRRVLQLEIEQAPPAGAEMGTGADAGAKV